MPKILSWDPSPSHLRKTQAISRRCRRYPTHCGGPSCKGSFPHLASSRAWQTSRTSYPSCKPPPLRKGWSWLRTWPRSTSTCQREFTFPSLMILHVTTLSCILQRWKAASSRRSRGRQFSSVSKFTDQMSYLNTSKKRKKKAYHTTSRHRNTSWAALRTSSSLKEIKIIKLDQKRKLTKVAAIKWRLSWWAYLEVARRKRAIAKRIQRMEALRAASREVTGATLT